MTRRLSRPRMPGTRRQLGAFFERLRSAERRALLLDFDGTLAPFETDREKVAMYPGVRSALLALILERRCRVAIVSGRPMQSLRRAVGLDGGVEFWASHGLERFTTDGCWIGPRRPRELTRFLVAAADEIAGRWPGLVEAKRYGLALHCRGRSRRHFAQAKSELVERWLEPGRALGLELIRFDGGLELRPAGRDKGHVIDAVFAEMGDEAAVAYLGDDHSDEDAFRALKGRGLTVLVRPKPRPTLADAWIRPLAGLMTFLMRWNAACCFGGSTT
jgi:trehalose 6-phosphate phosphatase